MDNIIENKAVKTEVIPGLQHPSGITRESALLLAALKHKQVRFAHWKSNGHLLWSLAGKTDLDLLIYPQDRKAFESVMQQLAYKKLQSQPWSSYPDVEDWIGLDEETGNFLHLHTHYALVTGIKHVKHLYLPWMAEFFQHVQTDPQTGWPVPRPELEAVILLIRIWAKMPPEVRLKSKPEVPFFMVEELVGLLNNTNPGDILHICSKLKLQVPPDLDQRIAGIRADAGSGEILNLARYFYGQVKPHYRKSWPLAVAESFLYKGILKIIPYTARFIGPVSMGKRLVSGGKIIALVGCDGSGKSSLSQDILNWLTYKTDTHYFYLGKNPFIKSYNKKILSWEELLFRNSFVAKALKKLIGKFYYVILIHRKVAMLQLARKMRRQGSVILCDRFPQQEIPGMNDGPNLSSSFNHWASALERQQFRQARSVGADLVFRLQVSPETAARRKPEHNYNQIKVKSENMKHILFPGAVVIDIDAEQSYAQVLLTIKRTIWKNL